MKWVPKPEWQGKDAYIIGGGPSLRGFDWNLFAGRYTVGCNSAFVLGPRVCSLCFFADEHWFHKNDTELKQYVDAGGVAVTNCEYIPQTLPWVRNMARNMKGLTKDGTVYFGYGGNSGACTIHLALLMGARRIFLFGFDGKLDREGNSNWHNRLVESPNPTVYRKFEQAFVEIAHTHGEVFPGTEIYNCNPDSAIPFFAFMDPHRALGLEQDARLHQQAAHQLQD
jgi:hypothetical protein